MMTMNLIINPSLDINIDDSSSQNELIDYQGVEELYNTALNRRITINNLDVENLRDIQNKYEMESYQSHDMIMAEYKLYENKVTMFFNEFLGILYGNELKNNILNLKENKLYNNIFNNSLKQLINIEEVIYNKVDEILLKKNNYSSLRNVTNEKIRYDILKMYIPNNILNLDKNNLIINRYFNMMRFMLFDPLL